MKTLKTVLFLGAALGAAACTPVGPYKGYDRQLGGKQDLSTLKAGVWIDPEGCDHWIIDDGVEGYLSARLDDYGKPICSGAGPKGSAVGPFRGGSEEPFDPL
ncbi:hypothetical protein BFP70_11430 [Thioclava sp. SK-1]|uniref:hypothetical protein n=1 Tax=Thioclava sp. SK-1 TaxID=1889770 RepID=UPI0008252DCF|nr:hypothetical protein [Thioclava sp. SK-1]OCX64622.1 hypothetical protein BFP70_11430 [Thioclava sp. SK-1]